MRNEQTSKDQRRKGRHRETDNQFVKRWMVTLACGCACVILSMSLMVSVWRNRQITQQAQFSLEAQRFYFQAMKRGQLFTNTKGRAFSSFQEQHHRVIRNGERYPAVHYDGDRDGDSDGDGDVEAPVTSENVSQETAKEKPNGIVVENTKSTSLDDHAPNVNADQSYEEEKSDAELERELLTKIRSIREMYNSKLAKHRERRAAGDGNDEEQAALLEELKQERAEYYKMIGQVKKIRARRNRGSESQTDMETRRQNRFERHRQAQRIQEEKYASKQLTDRFLKGEHRNVRDAAAVDDYPREDEISKTDSN